MDGEYVSISDIARVLGISKQAVNKQLRGKINAGEIEVKTEGKKDLIKYSTLPQEFKERLEESKTEAVEQAMYLYKDYSKYAYV